MNDILIISDDVVGEKMAGPGIRAWELSKSLSKYFKVGLAVPDYSYQSKDSSFFQKAPCEVSFYSVQNPGPLEELGKLSKIVLTQGYILSKFPGLKHLDAHIVVDVYVPFILENLFVHKWKVPSQKDRENIHLNDLRVFNDQLIHGDHFLCANIRQKDLFIGSLMALNRINPATIDLHPETEGLVSVVPFGISREEESVSDKSILRDKISQLRDDGILLLWGGVITNWFDPLTLIKATHQAVQENPKIKLLFLSTQHPNPLTPEFEMAEKAIQLASDLKIKDKSVFFNHDWVAYDERHVYFQEADIGASIHTTHFETRYSFRTRILDYIKYHLPIICTQGDHFAEVVEDENLGITVASENQEELKNAILSLAERPDTRKTIALHIKKAKERYFWDEVIHPLVKHCEGVLQGKIQKQRKPSEKDMGYLFRPKKDSYARRAGKRLFWSPFQKIPYRITAKVRRFLKHLD